MSAGQLSKTGYAPSVNYPANARQPLPVMNKSLFALPKPMCGAELSYKILARESCFRQVCSQKLVLLIRRTILKLKDVFIIITSQLLFQHD